MMPRWKINFFGTLLAICLILSAIRLLDRPEPGLNFFPPTAYLSEHERKEKIRFSIYEVLFDYGIRVDWIKGDSQIKTVRVPGDLAMVEPYVALVSRVQELGGHLVQAETNPFQDRMTVTATYKSEPMFQLTFVKEPELLRTNGKIAIVIDDFGYTNSSLVQDFINLPQKINYAVIPGLTYSAEIAQAVAEKKRDVLVHLPMEPRNGKFDVDDYDYSLLVEMDANQIRERVQSAIRSLPQAVGLNNHMGSMATENGDLLAILMEALKESGLFFLDSRTSANSQAFAWAKKMQVPCSLNNVFLDKIEEEPFIQGQLTLLGEMSARAGTAIGIGHPNELTLKVLQAELPKLEKRGFQFVSLSQIVE